MPFEKNHQFFAKSLPGFEQLLADEIMEIGATNTTIKNRGVYFNTDEGGMYNVLANTRLALRILVPVVEGDISNEDELYQLVQSVDWHDHLSMKHTFAIDTVTFHREMNHNIFLSQKTKDAIADQFTEKYGVRPDVNPKNPDIQVHLHINQNGFASISLDASGHSLNQRGYRTAGGRAPLNEVLAAGLIKMTGWDPDTHFIDPMCGSGTLLIEAALMAKRKAPALLDQEFGIQKWPYFREGLWKHVMDEANSKVRRDVDWIEGGDSDKFAYELARKNIRQARLSHNISLKNRELERVFIPEGSGVILTNPPYGNRLGERQKLIPLYKSLGNTMKRKGRGYTFGVITADPDFKDHIPLKPEKIEHVMNGPIECEFITFAIKPFEKSDNKENV